MSTTNPSLSFVACTQEHILPDECVYCGNWLHEHQQGGLPGPFGRYCTEDCAAGHQNDADLRARLAHLETRDLMCDCEVCSDVGHPTAAEIAEYRAYLAIREGT